MGAYSQHYNMDVTINNKGNIPLSIARASEHGLLHNGKIKGWYKLQPGEKWHFSSSTTYTFRFAFRGPEILKHAPNLFYLITAQKKNQQKKMSGILLCKQVKHIDMVDYLKSCPEPSFDHREPLICQGS